MFMKDVLPEVMMVKDGVPLTADDQSFIIVCMLLLLLSLLSLAASLLTCAYSSSTSEKTRITHKSHLLVPYIKRYITLTRR